MFWGLIMEPGRCYTQEIKVGFHISMAAIDITNASDEPSQVMCLYDGRNYLLCTLNKNNGQLQCPLDLNFEAGTKVSFATNGSSHIHLTGYLSEYDTLEEEEDEGEEEEEEGLLESEEEEDNELMENLRNAKKDKKRKQQIINDLAVAKKKVKLNKSDQAVSSTLNKNGEEEDDDDTSDSDFEIENSEEDELDETVDAEEEGGEEEEQSEDEDNDDDEEDEEFSEDEEQEKSPTIKQNGIPTKKEKLKQKQQQQQQGETNKTTPGKKGEKQQTPKPDKKPKKQVLKGGVIIEDLKEGDGEPVKNGKFVHVYYVGRLKSNNKVFDRTLKGPGFSFRLGKGEVIKGWDLGIVGMKVGGKRRIHCPSSMAYGPKGCQPVIPPNSALIFEVELKKIN